MVWFDETIKDKAAAERNLTVTTDPPGIVGAWHWINGHEVHWRPKDYWPAGTKVTVEAKVYGRNLGDGLYGQEDRTASFTIGRTKIAMADSKTHRMKVYIDGVARSTKINGKDDHRTASRSAWARAARAPAPTARSSTSPPTAARTWSR